MGILTRGETTTTEMTATGTGMIATGTKRSVVCG